MRSFAYMNRKTGNAMSAELIPENTTTIEIWHGVKSGMPVVVSSAPFGMLFGALAIDNGFSVSEAVWMSAAVFGGASQLVGIELFGQHVAPWLIILSVFAVNFRHLLYSPALGRRIRHWPPMKQVLAFFLLTDPQYAESETRGGRGHDISFAWYMGMGGIIYVCWVADTWIGATFGKLIPDPHALGIDFLLPIYFFGLVMGFRNRPLWLPVVAVSAVASIIAYKTVGSPWHVSIGALAGIMLAVVMPLSKGEASKP
jgi:predicted branched-subunit amino acid permease